MEMDLKRGKVSDTLFFADENAGQNHVYLQFSSHNNITYGINNCEEITGDNSFNGDIFQSESLQNGLRFDSGIYENLKTKHDKETIPHTDGLSLPTAKLVCEIHANNELTHFCRKCEVPVCKLCRQSTHHKGHRTKRIGVAVTERKERLSEDIKNGNDKTKTIRRNLAFIENEKASIRSSCDEVVARIRQRCAYMKNVLDTVANNLVKEVYYKKKDCIQQYTSNQKKLQCQLQNNEHLLDLMNSLAASNDYKQFLEEFKNLKEGPTKEEQAPKLWKEYVSFDHGRLSVEDMKEQFGYVNFVVAMDGGAFTYENKQQYGRLSCSTKRSFKCERRINAESDEDEQDSGPINAIVKSEDQIWVSCGLNSKVMSLIDESGETLKSIRIRSKLEDIAIGEDGGLLFSIYRDKVIRRTNGRGEYTDVISVPFHPKGIDLTKDGGYLICMCDSYSTSVSEESRRIVVKYSFDGKEEKIYEYDRETRIFTRPFRVAENTNGDICVIDKTSMGSGQVVILDKSGSVKAIYNGNRQAFKATKQNIVTGFAPTDIACDQNGRIFIVESDNHKIHLLNKDGCYIGHFLTSESDYFCPQCITTDTNNQIWIGNEYGEIKMFTCDWQ